MGNARSIIKRCLPRGKHLRRLPVGIGRGLQMEIDFHGGQLGLYLGQYERELNRHVRRLCRPGTRSFDIGGHVGYDALVIAKLTGAPVLTVECDSACCEVLKRNVAANTALAPFVSLQQGFVYDRTDAEACQLSLDDLAAQTFVPGFVKIDIEGAELRALQGAQSLLVRHKPSLLIEVHSQGLEDACGDFLSDVGYQITLVDQRRFLPDHRPSPHNRWIVAEHFDSSTKNGVVAIRTRRPAQLGRVRAWLRGHHAPSDDLTIAISTSLRRGTGTRRMHRRGG
jgi:hypothetical protein